MKTLLLAENHASTLAHLEELLGVSGFSVHTASDPESAREYFLADRPDAVVVALDFPPLGDLHLSRVLKSTDQGKRVPVVVIDKGHLGKSRGVGAILGLDANGYVANPLDGNALVDKLTALLSGLPTIEPASSGLERTLSRPTQISGELSAFPLPTHLCALHASKGSGIFVLVEGERVRRLFVREGAMVAFDSTVAEEGFVPFLVERGELTATQAATVKEALAQGLRLGAALVESGASLEGEPLIALRRRYLQEMLARAVGMRAGRFAFHEGDEFLSEVPAVEGPTLAPILESARSHFPLRAFALGLGPERARYPQREARFSELLASLGLSTEDLKIAMQMNGRLALSELLAKGRGDLRRIYSLVWFLQLTGTIRFSDVPLADGREVEAETLPPRKLKSLPAEEVASLREGALRILASSHFGALGLPITAESEDVEKAYHEVAPRFHADGYPEQDTSALSDLFDSIQEKLTAARRILSDEEKRKGYLQHLLLRLDVGRATRIDAEAEIAHQRGEAALGRGDHTRAILSFERAVGLEPREPAYLAALAWASFLGGSGSKADRVKAAKKPLKKALGLDPMLERAQVLAAVLELEAGDLSAARKKLVRALETNPGSVIAKAALRKVGR